MTDILQCTIKVQQLRTLMLLTYGAIFKQINKQTQKKKTSRFEKCSNCFQLTCVASVKYTSIGFIK